MQRRHFITTLATAGAATAVAQAKVSAASPDDAVDRLSPWGRLCRERANLAVTKHYVENLTTGNSAQNDQLKSPDMTVTTPDPLPYGGTLPDSEYVQQLFEYWSPPASPATSEPSLYPSADKVFLVGTFAATGIGTGTEIAEPLVEVFTLENELIVNDTINFFDLTVVLAALGG